MTEWVPARTWATSETVTASLLNVYIRDNLNHLRDEANQFPMDFPCTIDPRLPHGSNPFSAANRTDYNRIQGWGSISKARLSVGVSSGNICAAIYSGSSSGLTAVPNTRILTSGSTACPAVGISEVALGGTQVVTHLSHWMALACSNTTATFVSAQLGLAGWSNGVIATEAAFPCPTSATPSAAGTANAWVIVGVP